MASQGGDAEPGYKYDVAVSFAGEQRQFVERVVRAVNLPDGRVFYDADFAAELWGEDLAEYFTRLYSREARYVVMFISREYAQKEWARVERRAALARRMRTQAAYILPIRCDPTELEEVDGLLNTIGYLDGLMLGAEKVGEVLNKKLALAMNSEDGDEAQPSESGEPVFGTLVHDAAGLTDLVQTRPHSWQWAAFGSVLVQRREALRAQLRDHELGYGDPNGERLADVYELKEVVLQTMHDVEQNAQQLAKLVQTPAFRAAIGEPNNSAEDADAILHVANRVMDRYERYLRLAQRVRGMSAPADYIDAIDLCARLVDKPMGGINQFIDDYSQFIKDLPQKLIEAAGENIEIEFALPLKTDHDLADELVEEVTRLLNEDRRDDD